MYDASSAWRPWLDPADQVEMESLDADFTSEALVDDPHGPACRCGPDGVDDRAEQDRGQLVSLLNAAAALKPVDAATVQMMVAAAIAPLLQGLFDDASVYASAMQNACERLGQHLASLTSPTAICANPADLALIDGADIPVIADEAVPPGTLRIAVPGGWMEDGPSAWLDRVQVMIAGEARC